MSGIRSVRPSHGRHPSGERGSAYLFVLLLLFVLTVIALALVTITQTEVQIGGAERSSTRVLYGAESGLHMQFALQEAGESRPRRIFLDTGSGGGVILRERVDISAQLPLYQGFCNLCEVNSGGENYKAINFVTNSLAVRASLDGTTETALQASKLISAMVFVQPREPLVDESLRTFDPQTTVDDVNIPGLEVIRY
jgi:Tfp pilus assembly protein PilX